MILLYYSAKIDIYFISSKFWSREFKKMALAAENRRARYCSFLKKNYNPLLFFMMKDER